MLPRILKTQTQSAQPQQQVNNQPTQPDPLWSVVGQYGVGAAALLALLKGYADYQLKAAMEDRAMKTKENAQSLELEGRVMGSLLSQQENSVASTGQLLNTFIAKTLNQAESVSEQTSSLIATIGILTEAVKFLGDTQKAQTGILHELKEHAESHTNELVAFRSLKAEVLDSLDVSINLNNQTLAIIEKLVESLANTNINHQ